MKWAPEDRLDLYAARLLEEQPDPPRSVSLGSIIAAYFSLASLLLIPVVLVAGGILWDRRLFSFALLSTAMLALVGGLEAQEIARARRALQTGLAASGEVTRVVPGIKGSRIVTFRVDAGGPVFETPIMRSGAADVFVEGDVVQLMLDPQTRTVLFILGLLKPSPLYAPPAG